MPENVMNLYVVGKPWMWPLQHETGPRDINELHRPVGRQSKLTMTTEDVIHDFAVPAFRTKADVVPGRYTTIWFQPTKPGKYRIQCMEYCGLNHSGMGGWVYVMEQRDFDNWLSGNVSGQTPVEAGRDLFENKLGCASCHQLNSQGRGPKLTGVYGSEQKLTTGQTVTADDEYIRNSILNPTSQIVEGYQPIMPTFKGQVTEVQLVSLISYIKSLGGTGNAGSGSATSSGSSNAGNSNSASGSVPNPLNPNGSRLPTSQLSNSTVPGASNPNAPANRSEPTRQGENGNR
jgi:cytochrome c oxidase subunit 2